ncbi:MAG: hypothetical protein JXR83_02865, partial [Deltaproteobacteria bacterium]|nr:hypothetical protein [Deltaproteobacteria bacterium]
MAVCLALAVGACLPPEVPIAGKACNPRHPCGPDMACVAGQCQPSRCPERSCQLHRAIDCEGEPRVCLDQCWEPCAACAAVCDNGDLKRCVEESSGESWYCRPEEVCLVHISSSRSADCRVPPVQCLDSPDCDCLEGPWSLYPFCDEWETCVDISGGSVACRSNLLDAGRVDSSGDAGICDSATISDRAVRDAVAADGISALDSASAPDSSTVCDSAAVFDSSSVNDGPLPDRWSPDGSTPADAGVPEAG